MKKLKRVFLLAACLLMIVSSIPVGAIIPYSTYTYDIDGNYVESPHAYVPYETISSASLGMKRRTTKRMISVLVKPLPRRPVQISTPANGTA